MARTLKRPRNTTRPNSPIESSNQAQHDYLAEIHSNMKGDMTCIRRFTSEMVFHDQSDIEFRPNGSIVITPHPSPPLPNDIIICIIDHVNHNDPSSLYQCALVNKQFYTITNPYVWRLLGHTLQIRHEGFIDWLAGVSREQVETISQYITELNISHDAWRDTCLSRLLPHVRHLKHLTLNNPIRITNTTFELAPFFCQHLVSLDICYNALTIHSFLTIGKHCHQLVGLKWEMVLDQSPEWLDMLTDRCPLEHLEIYSGIIPITENAMTIMKKFNLLTHLELWCVAPMNTRHLLWTTTYDTTTTTNTPWPQPWYHLKSLILSPCHDLDDIRFLGFINAHLHLEDITLDGATALTDLSLDGMSESLAHLGRLTMTSTDKISQDGLRRFILASNRLVYFKPTESILKTCLALEGIETTATALNQQIIEKIKQQSGQHQH